MHEPPASTWPEPVAGHALAARTWPVVDELRPLLLVPIGSCEQHGPHLPLGTDTAIASAIAVAAARRLDPTGDGVVMVAPAIAIGASGEHQGFTGTLSIGTDVLRDAIVELVRSADRFRGAVLVNAHGGNTDAIHAATGVLAGEGRRPLVWHAEVPGGDAHAGRTETALMLAIAPQLVDLSRASSGESRPIGEILPTLRAAGVAAVSPNGVLGDPAGASETEGGELLAALVDRLVGAIEAWAGAE